MSSGPTHHTAPSAAEESAGREARVQSVIRRLRVVLRTLQRHSRRIEKTCGVSAAQLWAMWELSQAPGLSVSELSFRLSIHTSTASNMLDKLEAKHLIERRREGSDQRVVRLHLTGRGRALLETAPAPAQGELNRALRAMDPAAVGLLDGALERLLAAMADRDDAAALEPIDAAQGDLSSR